MLEKPMYRGSVSHFRLARPFQTLGARSGQRRGGGVLRGAGEHPLHRRIHFGQQVPLLEFSTKVLTRWVRRWVVCGTVCNRKGRGERITQMLHKRGAAWLQIQVLPRTGCVTWTKILVTNSVLGSVKWSLKYSCTFLSIIKRKEGKKVGRINKQITIWVWIYPYTGILSYHSKAW